MESPVAASNHQTREDPLHAAETKAQEYLSGWQRARADYENLQKRLDAELAEAVDAGKDALLRSLLPVVDYLEAAVGSVPETLKHSPWTEGVLQTHKALRRFLTDVGVAPFGDRGVPLDPALHEAIAEEASDVAAGTITRVVTPGYLRDGRVLRPAKVKVSFGPRPSSSTL